MSAMRDDGRRFTDGDDRGEGPRGRAGDELARALIGAGLGAALALGGVSAATGQHVHPAQQAPVPSGTPSRLPPPGQDGARATSIRITMEALHAAGGAPPGWRFSLPAGDPAAGRRAFVDLKCYACHAIKGERFPLPPGQAATAGPDLTGMGRHHPAGYLAESIANPSAVLVEGPGYIGGDGRSVMPEQREMTLAQLFDLVAYLKTLGGPDAHGDARRESAEQTAGRYRVRLRYDAAPGAHGAGHAHGGHGAGPGGGHASHGASQARGHQAAAPAGRLTALIVDSVTEQPVPYLPVRARIETPGQPPVTLTLAPALGPEGLVYGAATAAPARARRIVLTVGAATARLSPDEPSAFAGSHVVRFDWR